MPCSYSREDPLGRLCLVRITCSTSATGFNADDNLSMVDADDNRLAVFSTVEESSKALVAVRAKTLPDGKNIRAVRRNETARLTPS